MRKHIVIALALMTLLWSGCDEVLPQYDEPADVLEGSLQRISPDTVLVVFNQDGLFLGGEPTKIRIYVRNKYIQLLEGTSLIKGYVKFFAFVPVPKTGILDVGRSNIFAPPLFQERLAIPPGDSAKLEVSWNHDVIGGRIYDGLPYTERLEGTTRIRTFAPISVTAKSEIQIFERVQAIQTAPLQFTIVVQEATLNGH